MSDTARVTDHGPGFARRFAQNGGIVIVFLAVAVVATILAEPRFLNRLNMTNVLRNFAFLAIPSIAQMIVMTAGGFDLSVGAVVAVSSLLTASTMAWASTIMPGADVAIVFVALGAVLVFGFAVGLVNGGLVTVFDISPFLVTLAMMSILMGGALYFTQGIPIYGVLDSYIDTIGRGRFLTLPMIMWLAVAVVIAAMILQRNTLLGRHIYAVGSDLRSARLSGVQTARVTLTAYVLAACLAGFTGFLMTARIGSGQATIGATLALESIAAAVIGGTALRGGVGRAELVALAALFLTVIANAMNLVRVDSKYQTLVLGAVLIIALGIERLLLRRRNNG